MGWKKKHFYCSAWFHASSGQWPERLLHVRVGNSNRHDKRSRHEEQGLLLRSRRPWPISNSYSWRSLSLNFEARFERPLSVVYSQVSVQLLMFCLSFVCSTSNVFIEWKMFPQFDWKEECVLKLAYALALLPVQNLHFVTSSESLVILCK